MKNNTRLTIAITGLVASVTVMAWLVTDVFDISAKTTNILICTVGPIMMIFGWWTFYESIKIKNTPRENNA